MTTLSLSYFFASLGEIRGFFIDIGFRFGYSYIETLL